MKSEPFGPSYGTLSDRNARANTKDRGQTVQGQQYFPFYQHVCGKSDDSQISESQICIIHCFLKATAAQMASVSIFKQSW